MQVTNDFELLTMLSNVEDPRRVKSTKHHLTDILFTALCGSMAGCDTWPEIVGFVKHRLEWFRRFIPLAKGIHSDDQLTQASTLPNRRGMSPFYPLKSYKKI